ncbi:aspartate kinase domain protein [Ehrlichia chaffeensis str. Liberty]|uniref:Aspartokinase n=1 Tax=Ehrlichia chaffeensis (strain ATCC CRL-10679 / Arkansas) TaxID=205920 RepID=Q2GFJ5_EHRCR|nr:aspartate kinase [Ehrlichia chaffeensis]ABD44673.1 aspartate kinase [Ehrlichia chaffeensis str. Arkansas]AHX05251.1 aspartate kinase domain protein [Ehrlichia chaffeensis str. Jax]AHX06239.1 aspartate kinase domain protein [Ehrlichia chaffeensis str. Liberty]AHX07336.1 aspartate kinase domain protein [Ehrlichia chaffeensis str. Osceola]AHX08544.1 aspartate kinase domain protein [Ehrlichia chaffeensis str. Saint Vincent]
MKRILVKKFGGTSLQDIECINRVAEIIKQDVNNNYKVVVVVSAMGKFTDNIISQIKQISDVKSQSERSEYDLIISSGEQISCGLLSLALQKIGINAQSWLGWQLPIVTTEDHTKARIIDINTCSLQDSLANNDVAIVAGFQGMHKNNRVTTLGRGGSDTSAVAIAAALKVDLCYIYTDVDGIYTADPNVVPKARKLDYITYDEMIEMSSLGAKVLQVRSVEIAMKYNIKLCILSTFNPGKGTILRKKGESDMESQLITGVTCNNKTASITLKEVKAISGVTTVFNAIAEKNINVDMIIQSVNDNNANDITFTISEEDLPTTTKFLTEIQTELMYQDLIINSEVAKVSIIGVGMISHSGVAYKMFDTLTSNNIKILAVTTSEIKISVLISRKDSQLATIALHSTFGLDNTESDLHIIS